MEPSLPAAFPVTRVMNCKILITYFLQVITNNPDDSVTQVPTATGKAAGNAATVCIITMSAYGCTGCKLKCREGKREFALASTIIYNKPLKPVVKNDPGILFMRLLAGHTKNYESLYLY